MKLLVEGNYVFVHEPDLCLVADPDVLHVSEVP
jgi:hypothetical protein